jgi:hypothetical protein
VVYTWDTSTHHQHSLVELVDASTVNVTMGHNFHMLRALPVIHWPHSIFTPLDDEAAAAISMRLTDVQCDSHHRDFARFKATIGLVSVGSAAVTEQEQEQVVASVDIELPHGTRSVVVTMKVDFWGNRLAFWVDGTRSLANLFAYAQSSNSILDFNSTPLHWALISANSALKVEIVDQPDLVTEPVE